MAEKKMRILRRQTATDEDTDARVYAEVVVATTVNISRGMILLAKNIPFFTNPPHVAADSQMVLHCTIQ